MASISVVYAKLLFHGKACIGILGETDLSRALAIIPDGDGWTLSVRQK